MIKYYLKLLRCWLIGWFIWYVHDFEEIPLVYEHGIVWEAKYKCKICKFSYRMDFYRDR